MASVHLVIMLTDIKGFSERVNQGSRQQLNRLLELHSQLLPPVFKFFDGKIIKTIGDAFLVTFQSPTDAVKCGMAIQEILRLHNQRATEEDQLLVRVAVNAGEVEQVDGDVLGEAVNITARLEAQTEAGEVFFTEAVYLSMNRREAPSIEIGPMTFKGIAQPVKVYKAIREPDSDFLKWLLESVTLTERGPVFKGGKTAAAPKKFIAAAAAVLILIAAGLWLALSGPSREQVIEQARQAMVAQRYAVAVDHAGSGLKHHPGDAELETLLRDAGRSYLDELYRQGGYEAAGRWLDSNSPKPGYASLTRLKGELEARKVADWVLASPQATDSEIEDALSDLLARYPQSPDVPLQCARKLAGKIHYGFPVWLYQQALTRGAAPQPELFTYLTRLFGLDSPGWLERAHAIAESYYPNDYRLWAQSVYDSDHSGNVTLLDNAWTALKTLDDPRTRDPYCIHLHAFADGYWGGMDAARQAVSVFLEQESPERRNQLKAVGVTKRTKDRSGYSGAIDYTWETLAKEWGWEAPTD